MKTRLDSPAGVSFADPGGELIRFLLVALLVPFANLGPAIADFPKVEIKPGPAAMSEEERLLQADPANGSEHGIILLEQTEVQEEKYEYWEIGYHLRAKVFSADARALGDIEIDLGSSDWKLAEWWGRTIQADGTVQELEQSQIKEVVSAETRDEKSIKLKGALPGVTSGSVIDYGYRLRNEAFPRLLRFWRTVPLQRKWPVKELRLRWAPWDRYAHGFLITRGHGLDIETSRLANVTNLIGRNLQPVPDEPLMSPRDSRGSEASIFYFGKDTNAATYWTDTGKDLEKSVQRFLDADKQLEAILAELPGEAKDVEARLRGAYDWVVANIKLRKPEGEEGIREARGDYAEEKKHEARKASKVLAERSGTDEDIDRLLIGLARGLGVEANLAFSPDRAGRYWEKGILTMWQFRETLVAVRIPGKEMTRPLFLDPGGGLPYGQIPWWTSGTEVFIARKDGHEEVKTPRSSLEENPSRTRASLSYDEDEEIATIEWEVEGSGNNGFSSSQWLFYADDDKRKERLDELCGAGPDVDVIEAAVPDEEKVGRNYRLRCRAELVNIDADMVDGYVRFPVDGPWIAPMPEFTARKRETPLQFNYPKTDETIITVSLPEGFELESGPEPLVIDNPFGKYSLTVEKNDSGYRIERTFSLPHRNLPANRYAGVRRFIQQAEKGDKTVLEFRRPGP